MTSERPDTVPLWTIWRPHRDALPFFGEVCRMAREGLIPGAVDMGKGTPAVLAERAQEALKAMRERKGNPNE